MKNSISRSGSRLLARKLSVLSIVSWRRPRRHRITLTKRWNVRWLWLLVVFVVAPGIVFFSRDYYEALDPGTSTFLKNETDVIVSDNSLNLEEILDFEQWHPCGQHKCFYVSKQSPTTIGYVIGPQSFLPQMTHGWKLARRFQEQYNISHPLDPQTPPFTVPITPSLALKLQTNLYSSVRMQKSKTEPQFLNERAVAIQIVTPLSTPNILLKGHKRFRETVAGHCRRFLAQSVSNKTLFVENFRQSVRRLLDDLLPHEFAFNNDFQGVVTTDGRIHLIDFDNMIEGDLVREEGTSSKNKEEEVHQEQLPTSSRLIQEQVQTNRQIFQKCLYIAQKQLVEERQDDEGAARSVK